MLLAASCREKDEYLPRPTLEDAVYCQTVPYSISVGITPMKDKIDGVKLKNTFYEGDIIEITNPLLLAEPAILTSDNCAGKDKATFSGELKVKLGKTLTPGTTTLTAALRNANTSLHLYNDGKPFNDIKLMYDNLDSYSYWTCEDFTYNANGTSINLEQKTIFVKFDMPLRESFAITSNNAQSYYHNVEIDSIYAVPYGVTLKGDYFDWETKLDEKGRCITIFRTDCVPGIFSVSEEQQVYFSKGNYQYYNDVWQIAPCQYDFISHDNEREKLLYHWEINNIVDERWSLLSFSEWYYLLWCRQDAEKKYGVANVAGIEGIVLLPDNWQITDGFKLSSHYTPEEWTHMEQAGAVFLTMVGEDSSTIEYWTSSTIDDNNITLKTVSGKTELGYNNNDRGAVRPVCYRDKYTQFNPVNPPSDTEDRCIAVDCKKDVNTRFCICTHGFFKGQRFRITMKVKADYRVSLDKQLFISDEYNYFELYEPNYAWWYDYYHFRINTFWKEVILEGEFESDGKNIELPFDDMDNTIYFDDISLKIDDMEILVNGDCSTDNSHSFAVIQAHDITPITFIDKESIEPVEQDYIEPGTIIYDYYYDEQYPLFGEVEYSIETIKGKKYSILIEIRSDEANNQLVTEIFGIYNPEYHLNLKNVDLGTEWETIEINIDTPVEDEFCVIRFLSETYIYIRSLEIIYQGD